MKTCSFTVYGILILCGYGKCGQFEESYINPDLLGLDQFDEELSKGTKFLSRIVKLPLVLLCCVQVLSKVFK